jgi:hypothetical protein
MNLAISLGTLLLGGVLSPNDPSSEGVRVPQPPFSRTEMGRLPLSGSSGSVLPPRYGTLQPPRSRAETPPTERMPLVPPTDPSLRSPAERRPAAQIGDEPPSESLPPQYGYGRLPSPPGEGRPMPRPVPVAPTDPTLKSPDSPLLPPTAIAPGVAPGYGTGAAAGGYGAGGYGASGYSPSAYAPQSDAARMRAMRSATQSQGVGRQGMASEAQASRLTPRAGIGAASQVSKPFSGYSASPTISPYMNLYRPLGGGGALDNYNTFVRPLTEQQRTNQVIGGEIRGLQSNLGLQHSAIRRLGKERQYSGPQNANAPEYFQNYGNYYPAFSR